MSSPEERLAAEQAAEWVERLKAPTEEKRAEFTRWLRCSRLNVREMLLAVAIDAELGRIDPDRKVDIDDLIARSVRNVTWIGKQEFAGWQAIPRFGARWQWFAGAAAAAALLLVLGWFIGVMNIPYRNDYRTAVGEQRVIELRDGSVVHLNTQSQLRVAFSRNARDVHLLEGQATFKVKRNSARPFRAHVDDVVIQAIGTQFDIHRREDRILVAVIEGQVEIATGASAGVNATSAPRGTRVAAGEAITISSDRQITPPERVDSADITAWQRREVIFRGNTLEEIAAEFNRYNRTPQIRVEGEALQKRIFVLVRHYDADNPESLLDFLAAEDDIEVIRQGDIVTIRPRR